MLTEAEEQGYDTFIPNGYLGKIEDLGDGNQCILTCTCRGT